MHDFFEFEEQILTKMQVETLQEVTKEKGQAPYDKKSVKVVVLCTNNVHGYKNDRGEEKKVLNVAVGVAVGG